MYCTLDHFFAAQEAPEFPPEEARAKAAIRSFTVMGLSSAMMTPQAVSRERWGGAAILLCPLGGRWVRLSEGIYGRSYCKMSRYIIHMKKYSPRTPHSYETWQPALAR